MGQGGCEKKYAVAGVCAAVLCVVIFILVQSLLFQDISLTDDTIPYGYGLEYMEEDTEELEQEELEARAARQDSAVEEALLERVESEYTCKVADTNIDVNELGTYYVEYVYLKNGEERTKRFDIHVTDQTGPEITFLNKDASGNIYAFLNDESSLVENIALKDNCDGEITASEENVRVKT